MKFKRRPYVSTVCTLFVRTSIIHYTKPVLHVLFSNEEFVWSLIMNSLFCTYDGYNIVKST